MEYTDYQEILQHELPKIQQRTATFLEIAGMPHYENVDSNIWAFFFDPKGVHGLEDLFLQSLTALCLSKFKSKGIEKELELNDPSIYREVATNSDKRIDIAIENDDTVIMIENKIYHWLANDLDEYWNHYDEKTFPKRKKAGVVLSLHPVTELNDNFISITHEELNKEILMHIGKYLLNAAPKYLTFLYDFIENKKRFYMSDQTRNSFNFVFEHREKIKRLLEANTNFIDAALQQVDQARGPFEMARKTQRDYRYYQFSETPHFYYTILIRNILDEDAHYSIILEGNNVSPVVFDELCLLTKKLAFGKSHIQIIDAQPNHSWFHLLTIKIPFNVEKLDEMGSEIHNLITSPELEGIRKKVVERYLELEGGR